MDVVGLTRQETAWLVCPILIVRVCAIAISQVEVSEMSEVKK